MLNFSTANDSTLTGLGSADKPKYGTPLICHVVVAAYQSSHDMRNSNKNVGSGLSALSELITKITRLTDTVKNKPSRIYVYQLL